MRKFQALAHYFIDQCGDPRRFGATRLNKALWFADVFANRLEGKPITGETYVKNRYGPVPQRVLTAIRSLEKEGAIAIREPVFQFDARVFTSLRQPKSGLLSVRERQIADAVLDGVMGRTANEISELSHDEAWEAARLGEVIPINATLGMSGEVTEEVMEWAAEAVRNAA